MEPNNLDLTRQNNTTQLPVNTSAGIGTEVNGQDIFSTLRNLAATGNTSNYTTATDQQMVLPMPLQNTSNSWPYSSSNNWLLEQAKLSLFPMYDLLQQTTANTNSVPQQNHGISFLDQNIQNVAAETARKFASLNQQPLFGQLSSLESHRQYGNSALDLPMTTGIHQQASLLRSYPQLIPGTSQTAQMIDQSSSQKCPNIKPDYIQRELNAVHQSIEDFTDFDLQDFEDLLMDKSSNSYENSHSNESEYAQKVEPRLETISNNNMFPSQLDELENADKELDRLVSSLVANQNNITPTIAQSNSNDHDLLQNSSTYKNKFTMMSLAPAATATSSGEISLNMPKFTPPDSPSNLDTFNIGGTVNNQLTINRNILMDDSIQKERQSTSKFSERTDKRGTQQNANSLSMIPKEQLKRETISFDHQIFGKTKSDGKVPIYKQKLPGMMHDKNNTNQDQSKASTFKTPKSNPVDEYSFEDEFDEKPLLISSNIQSQKTISNEKASENQESVKTKRKYTRRIASMTNCIDHIEPQPTTSNSTPKLAEQIRRRNLTWGFLKSEIANDDNAAISEFPIATCILKNTIRPSSTNDKDAQKLPPPLPKLIIRIPRRESIEEFNHPIETVEITNKKKKRKKKKARDLDWTETEECKFIKHHKKHHKNKKHKKEKKKQRQSLESIDDLKMKREEINAESSEINYENDNPKIEISDEETIDSTRLHYFEHPTERPKRGTFLILKDDLFKPDCSLWRIDNQNLLQKYLPIILEDGALCYENSQTYSGWCESYVNDYIAIKVEYLKQSRSENIVRPLLPLQELFPAITLQMTDKRNVEKDAMEQKNNKFDGTMKDKEIRNQICNVIRIMLEHSVTLQFIQTIKQSNDWNYLRPLTEIELKINNRLVKIRSEHPLWSEPFVNSLKNFPTIFFTHDFNVDLEEKQSCQACMVKSFDVLQAIQLFAEEIYEPQMLVPKKVTNGYDSSICTIDFYICNQCADAASKYHKIYHLLYRIFKYCETKVEAVSAENNPLFTSNQIIEICYEDKDWIGKICGEVIEILY